MREQRHRREKPPYCAICRRRPAPGMECDICDPPTIPEQPSRVPADSTEHEEARTALQPADKEDHS